MWNGGGSLTGIPAGLCQCGCGGSTKTAKQTRRGAVNGQPFKFIAGHHMKAIHLRRAINPSNYRQLSVEGRRNVYVHVAVVEAALGKRLPPGAEIHHVDGDRHNNANLNLVVCQDRSYHMLLHARQRAIEAGANPNTQRVCPKCEQVKYLEQFHVRRRDVLGRARECRACSAIYKAIKKAKSLLQVDEALRAS